MSITIIFPVFILKSVSYLLHLKTLLLGKSLFLHAFEVKTILMNIEHMRNCLSALKAASGILNTVSLLSS